MVAAAEATRVIGLERLDLSGGVNDPARMTPQEYRDELRPWLETAELCERAGLKDGALACRQMARVAADALVAVDAIAKMLKPKADKKSLDEHIDDSAYEFQPNPNIYATDDEDAAWMAQQKAISRISDVERPQVGGPRRASAVVRTHTKKR